MSDDLRNRFIARLNAPPEPPLEATRAFLASYVYDADSLEEIRHHVRRMITINPRTIIAGLIGIEDLLREPQPPGTLNMLVAYDANWQIDAPGDIGAAHWLADLAHMLREELGSLSPPSKTDT